jgi:hypothetical protein
MRSVLAAIVVGIIFLLGCSHPVQCYRVSSADTWVSGGPSGFDTKSRSADFYGDTLDRTRSRTSGWNIDGGVNFHWDPSACEWEYEEAEEPPPPGNPTPGVPTPR